jgi:hypothetical protein
MVVTVVGDDGGAAGGFGEHGGGCPLGDAAPDTCSAVWVQPAAPAIRTALIPATRAGRNFRADIEITHSEAGPPSPKSNVRQVRARRENQTTQRQSWAVSLPGIGSEAW